MSSGFVKEHLHACKYRAGELTFTEIETKNTIEISKYPNLHISK